MPELLRTFREFWTYCYNCWTTSCPVDTPENTFKTILSFFLFYLKVLMTFSLTKEHSELELIKALKEEALFWLLCKRILAAGRKETHLKLLKKTLALICNSWDVDSFTNSLYAWWFIFSEKMGNILFSTVQALLLLFSSCKSLLCLLSYLKLFKWELHS